MGKVWESVKTFFYTPASSAVEKRMTLDDYRNMVSKASSAGLLIGNLGSTGTTETVGYEFADYVGRLYQSNGIVFACQVARMMIFSQVRFMYQNMASGRPEDFVWDRSLELFDTPWPNAACNDLLERAIQDADFAGNFYAVTEGFGASKRIRRLRPDWVTITLSAPPEEATKSDITGYVYKPGNTTDKSKWEAYPIDGSNGAVVHWAPIPDPLSQYKGMSWLTPVIREIIADSAATTHKGKFFDNAATPNIAVSLSDQVTPDEFKEFMDMMNGVTVGTNNAYKTLFLGGGADVTVIGSNLAQMDFKITQGAGETRIAAAARVHPVIVGLSEGMQGSSLNAGNFQAAKRSFSDGTMAPLWGSFANAIAVLMPKLPQKRLWWDGRDIPFLREDMKDVAEIQSREAETISKLTREGFTWDSVVTAITKQDWSLLKHTGLYSVQLQKPGSVAPPTPVDSKTTPTKGGKNVPATK